jgi:isocitrate dehydrogenase (NAD+)
MNTIWKLGDGIGPEISNSVQKIFEAAGVPLSWESVDVTPVKSVWKIFSWKNFFYSFFIFTQADGKFRIPLRAIESVTKNRIGLKGPLATRNKMLFSKKQSSFVFF